MPGHLPERIKTERSAILRSEAEVLKRRYREGLIGKTQRVLVESVSESEGGSFQARGLGEHYVPIHFHITDLLSSNPGKDFVNEYISVKVCDIDEGEDPDLSAGILP